MHIDPPTLPQTTNDVQPTPQMTLTEAQQIAIVIMQADMIKFTKGYDEVNQFQGFGVVAERSTLKDHKEYGELSDAIDIFNNKKAIECTKKHLMTLSFGYRFRNLLGVNASQDMIDEHAEYLQVKQAISRLLIEDNNPGRQNGKPGESSE